MKALSIASSFLLLCCLSSSSHSETRCHEEVGQCRNICDAKGENCRNDCTTKQVCVEVSPPPQTPQPAGGVVKGGAWGGVTVPINPK